MRARNHWMLIAVVIAVLCLVGWEGRQKPKTIWEYKITTTETGAFPTEKRQEMLNQQGAEGWELAQVDLAEGVYFFKRAKQP